MLSFLQGGGAVAEAIRERDWSDSPIGPPESWPGALKTTVGVVLGSRFPQCIVWGADLITIPNDAFLPILGDKPLALGRPFSEVWHEVWDDLRPIADAAFAGEATYIEDLRLMVDRHGRPEEAFFTFCYSPIRDERGRVVGMLDTVVETTAKLAAERHANLLNRELAHRVKNTLSVVQAIAHQTLARAIAADDALHEFDRRMAALAAAQDVLTDAGFGAATIREVVERSLEPHLPDAASALIEGPAVPLQQRHSVGLALAIHELATNAVKYGALARPTGRVSIRWTAGEPASDEPMVFTWKESGGPAVSPPTSRGFGSRLLERVLPAQFGGAVRMDYRPEGLEFELRTRMANINVGPVPAAG